MLTSNVTIVSPFRDNEAEIGAYMRRVGVLQWPADQLRFVFVEGDSVDRTWYELGKIAVDDKRVRAIKCEVGDIKHRSVVNSRRFQNLARVFNAGLNDVDLEWSDFVLMLPSDMRHGPSLLRKLVAWDRDVIAPFSFLGDIFYDTWAFIQDGNNWTNWRKRDLPNYGNRPIAMDSIGGVKLTRAAVLAAGVRYSPVDVDRGYCRAARELGFGVWADPTTQVEHD